MPKQLDRLLWFLMLPLLLVVTGALLVPGWREALREKFFSESRQILAKAEGDLTGKGELISVIKVKTHGDLVVEIYSLEPRKGETTLRSRLILPEKKDGYFQFRGTPTNLALADLNGDGILEIIAPTYDENLIPRLHVYRYDDHAQVFVPMGPDALSGQR